MSGAQWQRVGLATTGLVVMMACQAERMTDTAPPDPVGQLDGMAVRLEVNLQDSTIRVVAPASAPAPGGHCASLRHPRRQ